MWVGRMGEEQFVRNMVSRGFDQEFCRQIIVLSRMERE